MDVTGNLVYRKQSELHRFGIGIGFKRGAQKRQWETLPIEPIVSSIC